MGTRFWLHGDAAPYSPATFHGEWDNTASAVTQRIDTAKSPASARIDVTGTETSTDDEYDVLLYRGVSGPLAAGTIGTGTVNLMVGITENDAAANLHFHLHIWVTQGDSDTERGVLLEDYREAAGVNEFGTDVNASGTDLNAAVALSSLTVYDGDRLVVELGYAARNTSATSYNARLLCWYGVYGYAPALAHGGAYYSGANYIDFSETFHGTAAVRTSHGPAEVLILSPGDPDYVTQVMAEVAFPTIIESRVSQVAVERLSPTVVESRVSQAMAEILNAASIDTRVSQFVVEMIGKTSIYCGPPSLSPAALCGKPDVQAWLEWTVPMKEN
jgi:hypothetical protein